MVKSRTARSEPRYPRARHEFYIEEPFCDDLIVAALAEDTNGWDGVVWDPCCGCGNIPRAFQRAGIRVHASDRADRSIDIARAEAMYGHAGPSVAADFLRHDFLSDATPPFGPVDDIVFNPPYGRALLARACIEKALTIARRSVSALVNDKFLASRGRHDFFTSGHCTQILHLSRRPSMPPGKALLSGRTKAKGGKQDFAWVVFSPVRRNSHPVTRWLLDQPDAATGPIPFRQTRMAA